MGSKVGVFFCGVVMTLGLVWSAEGQSGGSFTDPRDGKTYRTVRIGNQTWMAENLNFQTGNSLCYGNDNSNCSKYGRLYDWNTAMRACPAGWRLPNDADWKSLIQAAGGKDVAGTKLKSGASAWDGTDDFGFTALSGGYHDTDDGSFNNVGSNGVWWSATESSATRAWGRDMGSGDDFVGENNNVKDYGFSVRCVR